MEKYSRKYDACILIVGIPIWCFIIKNIKIKKSIWFASIAKEDRRDSIVSSNFFLKVLKKVNLILINHFERKLNFENTKIFCLSEYTNTLLNNSKSEILNYPLVLKNIVNNNKEKIILHISRFGDERKNIKMLINVFDNLVNHKNLNYKLILIGDKPSKDLLKLIASKQLNNKIEIHPFLEQKEITKFYYSSKYFILTSNEEGLGIVLLEAMNNGCIVLSTKCGGPENIIKNNYNGLLSDKNDIQEMVNNFCIIENDIDMQKFLRKNSHNYLKNLHDPNIAKEKLNSFINH